MSRCKHDGATLKYHRECYICRLGIRRELRNDCPFKDKIMAYDESIMDDNHNIFIGYLYVCDGRVVKSHMEGKVRDLKLTLNVKEVKTCDIFGRKLMNLMEPFELRRI